MQVPDHDSLMLAFHRTTELASGLGAIIEISLLRKGLLGGPLDLNCDFTADRSRSAMGI
jgi:hypothetical protein